MMFEAPKGGKLTVTLRHFGSQSFWGKHTHLKMSRVPSVADKSYWEMEENTPKSHPRPPNAARPTLSFGNALLDV